MTGKRKATEPEQPPVVVHDYDPVRPHPRRKNETDDVPAWIGDEHPEVDE